MQSRCQLRAQEIIEAPQTGSMQSEVRLLLHVHAGLDPSIHADTAQDWNNSTFEPEWETASVPAGKHTCKCHFKR